MEHVKMVSISIIVHATMDSLDRTVKQISMSVNQILVVLMEHVKMESAAISAHALLVLLDRTVKQILMNVLLLHVVLMEHVMMELIHFLVCVILVLWVLFVKQKSTSVQVIPVFMGRVMTVSTLVYVSVFLDLLELIVKQISMNVDHNHVLMDTHVLMESIPSFAQILTQLCNPNVLPLHVKMVDHV